MSDARARKTAERRLRILQAATALFLEKGVSGATMEGIARAAAVAKPTLYAYFPDKEAVFRAALDLVIEDHKAMILRALEAEGDVIARVTGALDAKFTASLEMIEHAPAAEELMSKNLHSGQQFAEVQAWLIARLAATLEEAGIDRAPERAANLVHSADGLMHASRDAQTLRARIAFITPRLLSDPA